MNKKRKKNRTKFSEADKEKIINEMLPYIKYTALRLAWRLPPQLTTDDLISTGIIGLLDAIERYEENQGKILTFVQHRIKGAMLDELDKFNPISKFQRQKNKKINDICLKIEKETGRLPEDEEIAETLDLTLDDYYEALNNCQVTNILSIDGLTEKNTNGEENSLSEVLPDKSSLSPIDELQEKDKKLFLASIINELPEREKLILSLYYWDELTMKEISRVMDMTEGRVCQLHKKALIWVKERLLSDNKIKDFF